MSNKILIVGGGFGGVKAALELSKHKNFDITLISKQAMFDYYPTLYRAATGRSHVIASMPLSELCAQHRINIVVDTATELDRAKKTIKTQSGKTYAFDTLILALGMVTNYFGIKGLEKYSLSVKSIKKAEALKAHLSSQITGKHTPDLNYVIVGGGPTGIELAGALPGYLQRLMRIHGLPERKVHVDLIEAQPRLLPQVPQPVAAAITKRLLKLGVTIMTGKAVQGQTSEAIMVSGHSIASHTVVWTAGVINNPFYKANNFTFGPHGRVQVDEFLLAEPNIYVIGDNASTPYSGLAQTALHDAVSVAKNLVRQAKGQTPLPYKPKRPVYVFPVGEYWAAVVWGNVHIYGILGWLLRRAADWIGYHDFEPWWKATARTMADEVRED